MIDRNKYIKFLVKKFNLNKSLDPHLLKNLLNFQNSIPLVNYSVLIHIVTKYQKLLENILKKQINNINIEDCLSLFIISDEDKPIILNRLNRKEVSDFFNNIEAVSNLNSKKTHNTIKQEDSPEIVLFKNLLEDIKLNPIYDNFIKIFNFKSQITNHFFKNIDINNITSFKQIFKYLKLQREYTEIIYNIHNDVLETERLSKLKETYLGIFNKFIKSPNLENLNTILNLNGNEINQIFNLKLTIKEVYKYFNIDKQKQNNITIEKNNIKQIKNDLEKKQLEIVFNNLKNNPSLLALNNVLSLNKRNVLKHFNIELTKESIFSFLNMTNNDISIIKQEEDKINKEKEEVLIKRKWQSELLHSSTLFSKLNITKVEFDKWRKDGRIPISDTQEFKKWGQTLTTTLHHPNDISHINSDLINQWRESDKNTQKNKRKNIANNEEVKNKRLLKIKVKKFLIELQKEKIFYDGNNLYKEYLITYAIDGFNYNANMFFYFEYNIEEINLENIENKYMNLIDFFRNKDLKNYENSLTTLIKKCLLSFEDEINQLNIEDKKYFYDKINFEINENNQFYSIDMRFIKDLIKESLNFIKQLNETKEIRKILNIEKYEESFPIARNINRSFNVILGPTNSGKTFEALETLKNASSGVYLAPLRLLAMEIFDKLNAEGIPCNLHTGEENIDIPGAKHTACTIEMMDSKNIVDIAVIDEVQMLADVDRGWAWTAALTGIPAKEIFAVGSKDVEFQLINLLNYLNEDYKIHYVERKTPLKIDKVINFSKILDSDVIVTFSRKNVLFFAEQLENKGFSTSMIYGALSPEVRRTQIENFSNGVTNCLVATDAIGMGVNIPAKRIIFSNIEKYDGNSMRLLTKSEIKQIAGRSGRFGIHDIGFVSAFNATDLAYIKECLNSDNDIIKDKLIISPSFWHVNKLSNILKTENIIKILSYFSKVLPINHHLFKTAKLNQIKSIANFVENIIPHETLENKFIFSHVPCNIEVYNESSYLKELLLAKMNNKPISLFKLPSWINDGCYSNLFQAENLNKNLTIYCYLHYRFPEIYITSTNEFNKYRNKLSNYINISLLKHNQYKNYDIDY